MGELVATDAALSAPVTAGTSLPRPLSSFIGREDELAALIALLGRERLVVLTGPPGVGKTRLALRLAELLQPRFRNGVAFVALAGLDNPQLVPAAIARVLGVQQLDQRLLEELLTDALRSRELLLILDNVEHVLEATPLVGRLLAACPQLRVLATSRERLGLNGEQAVPLAPLPLPPAGAAPSAAALRRYGATRLFVERCEPAWADRVATDAAAPLVAGICAQLDGLPLAIELVVPRLRIFSLQELQERLQYPLDVALSAPRDAPARQRTLRAAISWSYALLSSSEQQLLRRLGVFAGGCTREAALAVCTADGQAAELEEGLASLVDKSLVQVDESEAGTLRFTLLRTVREFAREELAARGEREAAEQRHAAYYAALAEQAAPELLRAGQCGWLARLERELENLRVALDWSLAQEAAEPALTLAEQVLWYWLLRGAFSEGRYWLEKALAQPGGAAPNRTRARALTAAGALAWFQSDVTTAQAWLEQSMALCRSLTAQHELAQALAWHALAAIYRGDTASAVAASQESLPLFHAAQDTWGIAWSNHILGTGALFQSPPDWEAARRYAEACLAGFRETGDRALTAVALGLSGQVVLAHGDVAGATACFTEMLRLMRELGSAWGRAMAALITVAAARHHGQRTAQAQLYQEALQEAVPLGEQLVSGLCVAGLAGLYSGYGDPARAVYLLAAAGAWLEAIGTTAEAWQQQIIMADYERDIAALRAALGEEAFATAWASGQRLACDDVFVEAFAMIAELSQVHLPEQPPAATPPRAAAAGAALTAREVEVLTLLARGSSAPEIARALTISRTTAQRHIANLYAKIGARGRVDAVAFAFTRGLVTPDEA